MEKTRRWIALTLLLTFAFTTIQAQPVYNQDEMDYSSAYMESNQSAHWSAYVPIGLMVAAAIWFGIVDETHSTNFSSKSNYGYSHSSSHSRHSNYSYSRSSHSHQ